MINMDIVTIASEISKDLDYCTGVSKFIKNGICSSEFNQSLI